MKPRTPTPMEPRTPDKVTPMNTPAPQLDLFDRGPPPAAPPRWIGHRGPWGRNLTWTRPDMPGLTIRHCGHGTALYPYYVTIGESMEPAAPGTVRTLTEAQAAAVALWSHARQTTPPL